MTEEWVIVAGGAVLSATLYFVGYLQLKRRFPGRAVEYTVEALLTAAGATVAAALRGYGPVMWAMAPAVMVGACFVAGKGSVAVLMHEGEDGAEVPEETARARKRLVVIFAGMFVVLAIHVFAMEE